MVEECLKKNRLASERSPYLRMHSCDPVDWHTWKDAIKKATSEDKPLFISIGYSSCHWCHVMARESFSNPRVAEILNRSFIPVKVDREENPEVDAYYMDYCMIAGGHCGWPLTVIAVPDGRPFYVATYLPREHLIQLLLAVEDAWRNMEERRQLYAIASRAGEALEELIRLPEPKTPEPRILYERAYNGLSSMFDPVYGGFGTRPKFPMPRHLSFLTRQALTTGSSAPLQMALHTLGYIGSGGIHDIVGGGWHRYAIDRMWIQPHFEKMLYTQGLMIYVLAEAAAAAHVEYYTRPALWAIEFLDQEMGLENGLYGSALDAESDGIEGAYYTWTVDELEEVDPGLGVDIVELFNATREGNIIDEATGERLGVNALYIGVPWEDKARELGVTIEEFIGILERIRSALYRYRAENKPKPRLDDKPLVDWNSLVAAGIARLSRTTGDHKLLYKSATIIESILNNGYDGGRVAHVVYDNNSRGTLYDYSYLLMALVELYEASLNLKYIELAVELSKDIIKEFVSGDGVMKLDGARVRAPAEDTSMPSPVGTTVYYMIKASRIMGIDGLEDEARKILKAYAGLVEKNPQGHLTLIESMILEKYSRELVVVSHDYSEDTVNMLRSIKNPLVTAFYIHGENSGRRPEYARSMIPVGGKVTLYLCRNKTCSLPSHDPVRVLKEAEAPI